MTAPRILVVCVGNVCRSPLAERLLRARLPEGVEVTSAGTNALVGEPMDRQAAAELRERGGSDEGFAARRLTRAMVEQADLVLTATTDIRSRVLEEAPVALHRTFTLKELAALLDDQPVDDLRPALRAAAQRRSEVAASDLDVPDPYRRGTETHAEAAQQVDDAVRRIAAALAGATA
ncbi:arsenate reductase/protein-tyrosine-phosphatase family protein [Nocardioides marmoraquaticus]